MASRAIGAARVPRSNPVVLTPFRIRCGDSPIGQFAPLAAVFRRQLLTGLGTASLVAVGANFCGLTSFLLGFSPELARELRLDVLYRIQGFSRCLAPNYGFELKLLEVRKKLEKPC